MKRLAIGGIAQDRAWILPRYLDSIYAILPPEGWEVVYTFVAGDRQTTDIIMERKATATIWERIEDGPQPERPEYSYRRLSDARNDLLSLAFGEEEADALLTIDSDILVEPEIAQKLAGSVIAAAPVRNSPAARCMNFLWRSHDGYTRRMADHYVMGYPLLGNVPIRVDLVGACVWIPRSVWEKGVRYNGTDEPRVLEDLSFAEACRAAMVPQWVVPGIRTEHFMDRTRPEHGLLCADFEAEEKTYAVPV